MNPNDAKDNIGSMVVATDPFWGSYIGELINTHCPSIWRAKVRVLACIEYPSQKSIMGNGIFQRYPYPYAEIQNFDLESLELYTKDIPEYHTSVNNALETAIEEREHKQILRGHKNGQAQKGINKI